ncbi:MAG: isoprenylcysteine carboxylmethyltransferase family protein [Paracoccaceae bacterium]|nr:isoprenylcysteine carboxylmethyltransferase family protein [Paracoccaceae bacterium]
MKTPDAGGRGRLLSLRGAYGVACYAVFAVSLTVLGGVLSNLPGWPVTMDGKATLPAGQAAVIDLLLIAAFGVQHSGMARRAFKRRLTRIVPEPVERSTYVLTSSLTVILLCLLWQPIPVPVWRVASAPAAAALMALGAAGLVLAAQASFAIDHFALFGLRQSGVVRGPGPQGFITPGAYAHVRHPIYLGTLILLWAVPVMSLGHLVFSTGLTLYTVIGARLEERDLIAIFGETYRRYRATVPMLLPRLARR